MEHTRPNYQSCVKGLLLALSIELNRIQEQANAPESTCGGPTSSSGPDAVHSIPENALVISPALDYIEDHYSSQFPIEVLADLCHMSLTHFPARFPFHHADQPAGLLKQHPHHEGLQPAAQHGGIHSFHFRNGGLRLRFQLQPAFSRGIHMTDPREYRNQMLFCPAEKEGTDIRHHHPGILRLDGTRKAIPL